MKGAYVHNRIITGIFRLRSKDLHTALNIFSEVSIENLPEIGIYTSFYDLARYIAILGVACYKREEIQPKVIKKINNCCKMN